MSTSPVASPEAPAGMSSFGRFVGVFLNPKATFADIAQRPGWIVPVIVMTIIAVGLSAVLANRANWKEIGRQQIENNSFASRQFERLTPEQREDALERSAKQALIMRYIRSFIGPVLLVVIVGGIYLGGFNILGGARLRYKQALAIVSYAYMPLALRELIAIPVNAIKDPSGIDPENFLASNAWAFLSNPPLWKAVFASWFDVFGLWALVLLALGFAAANPRKVSLGKAFGIVFGISFTLLLIFTGIASLFS